MTALREYIQHLKDEVAKWRYKALKLGLYAARLHGLPMAEDPERPQSMRSGPVTMRTRGGNYEEFSDPETGDPLFRFVSAETAAALLLYVPPFRHERGFIFDSKGFMVADQSGHALRVRGWGRISYQPDADKLQDAVGVHIAQALTQYWTKKQEENQP